jgi:amino acid permease
METRPLARADLITGAVLAAFGIAAIVESWNMPRLEERSINPWTVPGLVPGLLGVIIAMLGVILAVRSVLAGGMRPGPADADPAEARAGRHRFWLCLILCLVYAILLVGRLPFWLATVLFVFAFIAAFEWRRDDPPRARTVKWVIAGVIAVLCTVTISYSFEYLFLVRLP